MCAVKKIIWAGLFAATVIVACVMIYEDLFLDRGIYGGGARLSSTLVIGQTPGPRYGVERESYWIDQTGECVIPYLESIPAGYKHHVCANVLVGDLSLPLPLRPWADGALALLAVGTMGWFFGIHSARPRTQAHEESVSS
jgi:hypothetical protein